MTAGPLWRCWGFAQRKGEVPTPRALNRALDSVGSHLLELEEKSQSVRFLHPELELNLGGIGKGYALDRAAALLRDEGLSNALLHAGHSSILALGSAPRSQAGGGWQLSLRHPLQRRQSLARIRLRDRAMATSGVGEQSFRAEGKRYGHVLDPRTGHPTEKNLSATAFAGTAAEADALSTAFLVMDLAEVREYCHNDPGVGALLVPASSSGDAAWVALAGDAVVGGVSARLDNPGAATADARARLDHLLIAPAWRDHGLAARLLDTAEASAAGAGRRWALAVLRPQTEAQGWTRAEWAARGYRYYRRAVVPPAGTGADEPPAVLLIKEIASRAEVTRRD